MFGIVARGEGGESEDKNVFLRRHDTQKKRPQNWELKRPPRHSLPQNKTWNVRLDQEGGDVLWENSIVALTLNLGPPTIETWTSPIYPHY